MRARLRAIREVMPARRRWTVVAVAADAVERSAEGGAFSLADHAAAAGKAAGARTRCFTRCAYTLERAAAGVAIIGSEIDTASWEAAGAWACGLAGSADSTKVAAHGIAYLLGYRHAYGGKAAGPITTIHAVSVRAKENAS